MTTGTVAVMILTNIILGRGSPWTEVYDPSRSKPAELLSVQDEASRLLPG